jgi:hypothetical protein
MAIQKANKNAPNTATTTPAMVAMVLTNSGDMKRILLKIRARNRPDGFQQVGETSPDYSPETEESPIWFQIRQKPVGIHIFF